jgi:diacylglycerol kinase (ATP)
MAPDPGVHRSAGERRALVVLNGGSRRGAAAEIDPLVERLRAGGYRVELHQLLPGEHLEAIVTRQGAAMDAVVLGGGDGTLSAAAPGIVRTGVPLGILPLGTANDFARGVGVPLDLEQAVDVILGGRLREVDLGEANGQLFFNAAGIGLGPALTQELTAEEKARWGVLAYPRALLRSLHDRRAFHAAVRHDARLQRLRVLQLTVANGKFYGGGMTAHEQAEVDDGLLNLLAIRPAGILELLRLAPQIWKGRAGDPKLVSCWAREIEVTTRKPMPVTTDGEFTTQTPVRFTVRRGAVRVFVP